MSLLPRPRDRRIDADREQSRTRRRELVAQLSAPLRSFFLTESGSAGLHGGSSGTPIWAWIAGGAALVGALGVLILRPQAPPPFGRRS